jgi:hypothetical protein
MSSSSPDPQLIARLAAEWRERVQRGERPQLEEYTTKYPEQAGEIRDLFSAVVMIEDLKEGPVDLTGPFQTGPVKSAEDGGRRLERIGDFRILREVGRGGMGIVYEAVQESLGRRVALKVLPAHPALLSGLDPQQQKRFQREAKAAARLHHTNIVPVYGVGESDGMHYYVMQFIQGQGLDRVLETLKQLGTHQARGGGEEGRRGGGKRVVLEAQSPDQASTARKESNPAATNSGAASSSPPPHRPTPPGGGG